MRIFVTVGNALVPFERLLRMVDEVQARIGCAGICQHGVSTFHPRGLVAHATLSKRDFEEALRSADAVVCHAGVGTLWSAIEAGHTPLVFPRRKAFGEVVNDHQLDICNALEQTGRIFVVTDANTLEQQLRRIEAEAEPRTPLTRDASRLKPVARALAEVASATADSPRRRPSHLLQLLAALGPPLERLRVKP